MDDPQAEIDALARDRSAGWRRWVDVRADGDAIKRAKWQQLNIKRIIEQENGS